MFSPSFLEPCNQNLLNSFQIQKHLHQGIADGMVGFGHVVAQEVFHGHPGNAVVVLEFEHAVGVFGPEGGEADYEIKVRSF